jgi:hypothetical protein
LAAAAMLMPAVHLTGVASSAVEARTMVGRPERPSLLLNSAEVGSPAASHRAAVLRLRDWTDAADRAAASQAWWRLERRASVLRLRDRTAAADPAATSQAWSRRECQALGSRSLDQMDAADPAAASQARSRRERLVLGSQRLDQRDAAQWVVRIAHPVSPKLLSA